MTELKRRYSSNKLIEEGEYTNGVLNGYWKVWSLTGQQIFEGQFKDGQPVGLGKLTQHYSKFPGEYEDIFKNEW